MNKILVYIIFSFIVLACSSENNEKVVTLMLSESEVIADYSGITKTILVTTNSEWTVSLSPKWCSVEKIKNSTKELLVIRVHSNGTLFKRMGTIVIETNELTKYIQVTQNGIKKNELNWSPFPVNDYSDIQYHKGIDGNTIFTIKGSKIFINPYIRQQIYHGNMINNESESIYNITNYKQYIFENITIGGFINGYFYANKFKYPSKKESDLLAKKIINTTTFQNESFNYDEKPIIYNSYKQLNFLGVSNLGIKLEELISGKSYLNSEIKKQKGMIYTYSHELFYLIMDYPEKLSNNGIENEYYYTNLSYISQITYGKTALLIVETNSDVDIVQKIIKKLMQSYSLNDKEIGLISNADFYYLFFDNNGDIQTVKGNSDLVTKYKSSIEKNDIMPLSFSLNKYSDNSVSQLKFKLHLK